MTWRILVLAFLAVAPLVVLALLLGGALDDPSWAVPRLHFFVVTLASALAIGLAGLMLVAAGQLKDARVFFLALGFLGLAGVFLVHAITTPGALIPNDNVWVGFSARLSLFVGAVLLALGTVNWRRSVHHWIVEHQATLVLGVVGVLFAFGLLAFTNASTGGSEYATTSRPSPGEYSYGYTAPARSSAPTSTGDDEADAFFEALGSDAVAITSSALTLALFTLVVYRHARLYRLSRGPLAAGFLMSGVFLFQAELSMTIAPAWHASWWEYHGLMVAAFGAAIAGLVVEYGRGASLMGVVEGLLVRDTLAQLQRGYTEVIVALVEAMEAKDPYTRGHTQRVAALSVGIGEQLGLSPERLRVLHQSAMLHDIGKIGVPDAVLNKPGRLTPEEFAAIKEHPVRGHAIIRNVRSLRQEVGGVRSHHERLDGSGYPDGLAGDEIPLDARIIAVADVFDALTSARAYRDAWPIPRAMEQIRAEAGSKLDPRCVAALELVIERQFTGGIVVGSALGSG